MKFPTVHIFCFFYVFFLKKYIENFGRMPEILKILPKISLFTPNNLFKDDFIIYSVWGRHVDSYKKSSNILIHILIYDRIMKGVASHNI